MSAKIALYYDVDAYQELSRRGKETGAERGLWGRHVAGQEFLDAYLEHGTWNQLLALVRQRSGRRSLIKTCQDHPSSQTRQRRLRFVTDRDFLQKDPPAELLYLPQPPDDRYAWARHQASGHGFAICGVTHTLCSARAVRWLNALVTSPFEEYDALICTSRSVVNMVRAVVDNYADFLRQRYGGHPKLRPRLEVIPLGVNVDRFTPATPGQRTAQRRRFQITDEELAVLYVGRLAAHGKVHPFPIFQALARAAVETGKKIHLLISGWANTPQVLQAWLDAARQLAPGVRVTFVDGTHATDRFAVWHAADVFTSLSDNLQETFGLVVVEAMASGLPVVATDWDGYRDLVVHGQTGALVPTSMIQGATIDATSRLLMGLSSYDEFIGQCNQATTVDMDRAVEAFVRLIRDEQLKRQWGAAARRRAEEIFDWRHIVRAYEKLWANQITQRQETSRRRVDERGTPYGPDYYPAPEKSFATYPTSWLDGQSDLIAVPGAKEQLELVAMLALTNYGSKYRTHDLGRLNAILEECRQPTSIQVLADKLEAAAVGPRAALATIAWLLKYNVLSVVRVPDSQ
ncbi:MAG: glycosyltransferase family 4 protein [Pirellulales bacterium]